MALIDIFRKNKNEEIDEYYNAKPLLRLNAFYNFLISTRAKGKSYQIQKYVLERAWLDRNSNNPTHHVMYIRRYEKYTTQYNVDDYWSHMAPVIEEITNGEYNRIVSYRSVLYWAKFDVETLEIIKGPPMGKYLALNTSTNLKSLSFPQIENIIFEEFQVRLNEQYIPDEVNIFLDLVSTVVRNLNPAETTKKVFLIGNKTSRRCPYFDYFGMGHVRKMQAGEIQLYEEKAGKDEVTLKIAVQDCDLVKADTKVFVGEKNKNQAAGVYECRTLPDDKKFKGNVKKDYRKAYELIMECEDFRYLCRLLTPIDGGKFNGWFWFISVYDYNSDEWVYDGRRRIISDKFYNSPLATTNLRPIAEEEVTALNLLLNGKKQYDSALTYTEFEDFLIEASRR